MSVNSDFLILLTSAEIGDGVADLGARLTELFLRSLAAADERPAKILFLNTAVFLTTEGSLVLEPLEELARGGTELVSCITCLEYFNRRKRLAVGVEGNMQDSVHAVTTYGKVVSL